MDYGQTNQKDMNSDDFFTAGAGTSDEALNDVSPENDLDLSNNATSWNAAASRFQSRNFGRNAIGRNPAQNGFNNIAGMPNPESGPDFGPAAPELGQITDLEQPAPKKEEFSDKPFDYSSATIRIENDSLSPEAERAINLNEKNLKNDGDAAAFAEIFSQLKADNAENTYGINLGGK